MPKDTNLRPGWGAFFDAALYVGLFVGSVWAINLANMLFKKIFSEEKELPQQGAFNDVLVPPAQALNSWRKR